MQEVAVLSHINTKLKYGPICVLKYSPLCPIRLLKLCVMKVLRNTLDWRDEY